MEESTYYKIKLVCDNCGKHWDEKVGKGRRFKKAKDGSATIVVDFDEGHVKTIQCPECGCSKGIRKEGRIIIA